MKELDDNKLYCYNNNIIDFPNSDFTIGKYYNVYNVTYNIVSNSIISILLYDNRGTIFRFSFNDFSNYFYISKQELRNAKLEKLNENS